MAVFVAQLVEQLLPTPEIRGSNTAIGKFLYIINCIEKTKIKKKRPGMAHLKISQNEIRVGDKFHHGTGQTGLSRSNFLLPG